MARTARQEYKMQFNVSMNMDDTWKVFDMDTGEVVADNLTLSAALSECMRRNRNATYEANR